MAKAIDISGQRFGRLVALEATENRSKTGAVMWRCKCDCGNECEASSSSLRGGQTRSCGCLHGDAMREAGLRQREDLSGKRFGRLTVIEPTIKKGKHWHYLCRCDCGNTCEVSASLLRQGKTRSCGCLHRELAKGMQERRTDYVAGSNLAALNRKIAVTNTSGIKGVTYDKRSGKWRARITFRGKRINLGQYDSLAAAAEARREAELELFEPLLSEHGRSIEPERDYEMRLNDAIRKDRSTDEEDEGGIQGAP